MTEEKIITKEKTQHTPTPWEFVRLNWAVYGKGDVTVCRMANVATQPDLKEIEANAALIVRAVNSHEALLQITKDFGDFLNENYDEDNVPLMEAINRAIAQAEENL